MKRQLLVMFGILMVVGMLACSAPPEGIPSAEIQDGETPVPEGTDAPSAPESDNVEEVASGSTDESSVGLPIDMASSTFTFVGYGPGKEHKGTFNEMSGTLTVEDGKIVAAEGVIQVASIESDSGGLDTHLLSEDFFNVEVHPTIEMESNSITYNEDGTVTVTGDLTLLGVTQEISFPATATENSISTDFLLDVTQFGFGHTAINDEVRIMFDLNV